MAVVTVLLRLYQGQTIKPSSAPTVVHGRHWRAWEWNFPNRKKYWNPSIAATVNNYTISLTHLCAEYARIVVAIMCVQSDI